MGKQYKRRPRKARREEAEQRAAGRKKLTPSMQLQVLDARLGVGKGAQRERARLMAMEEA